jgi:hypothetical protein
MFWRLRLFSDPQTTELRILFSILLWWWCMYNSVSYQELLSTLHKVWHFVLTCSVWHFVLTCSVRYCDTLCWLVHCVTVTLCADLRYCDTLCWLVQCDTLCWLVQCVTVTLCADLFTVTLCADLFSVTLCADLFSALLWHFVLTCSVRYCDTLCWLVQCVTVTLCADLFSALLWHFVLTCSVRCKKVQIHYLLHYHAWFVSFDIMLSQKMDRILSTCTVYQQITY